MHRRLAIILAALTVSWVQPGVVAAQQPSAAGAPVVQAAPGEPANLMVLLDGSGSMWGRIAGSQLPKFATAREALRAPLASLPAASRIGLASFGHRRQADCSDVEVMIPADNIDPQRVLAPLDKLNPKGKGPMAKALRDTAGALRGPAGAKHIVLIHDDTDNCGQDPCQAAAEINAADPSIKIHVVSLAMKADDANRPVCLARITGGTALPGEDAAEAGRAIERIFKSIAATVQSPAGPAPATVPTAKATPPAPAADTGSPRLLAQAVLKSGGTPIDQPLRWRVAALSEPDKIVAERVAANPVFELAPGPYRVRAESGLVTAAQDVDVGERGVTRAAIDLQAASLSVSVSTKAGAAPTATSSVALSRPDGEPLHLSPGAIEKLLLPPGEVRIVARDGEAAIEQVIDLAAGQEQRTALLLGSGRIRLAALGREGGPALTDVVFRVTEDDPDASEGFREVARSSAAAPDFIVPAGAYTLVARHRGIEMRERVIVAPGEEVNRVMVLQMGRARLSLSGSLAPEKGVNYGLELLPLAETHSDRRRLRSATGLETLDLAPGRYRIVSRLGSQNATAERTIDVKPGTDIQVALEIPVGRLDLAVSPSAGGLFGADMAWQVIDAAGATVLRTMQARPKAYLAPGTYLVTVEGRDQRATRSIEVKAGAITTLEVQNGSQ